MAKKIAKHATSKAIAKELKANVPDEYVFRCCDGRVFRSTKELGDALSTMSDETFAYHSNTEKSDFSNWVRDVIKDETLAEDMGKSPDRSQAAMLVATRISALMSI